MLGLSREETWSKEGRKEVGKQAFDVQTWTKKLVAPLPSSFNTGHELSMEHRKWRETSQQPSQTWLLLSFPPPSCEASWLQSRYTKPKGGLHTAAEQGRAREGRAVGKVASSVKAPS